MFKTSISLGNITDSMKLSFVLIVEEEDDTNAIKRRENVTLSKFNFKGTNYIKFNPHPYVVIDISKKGEKGENWDRNNTVTINRQTRFKLVRELKTLFNECIRNEHEIYKKNSNGKLTIDTEIRKKYIKVIHTGSKCINIIPAIYKEDDTDINRDLYECPGIVLMINNIANYCKLTFDELAYLIKRLDTIDYDSLSFQLLDLYHKHKDEKITEMKIDRPVPEYKNNETEVKSKTSVPKVIDTSFDTISDKYESEE